MVISLYNRAFLCCFAERSFLSNQDFTESMLQWREFIIPFGKYENRTLGEIRVLDQSYLVWLDDRPTLPRDLKHALSEMFTYINRVDPWSVGAGRFQRQQEVLHEDPKVSGHRPKWRTIRPQA